MFLSKKKFLKHKKYGVKGYFFHIFNLHFYELIIIYDYWSYLIFHK